MGIRTGKEYKEGLKKKPRDVWIDGKHITNVLDQPIFTFSSSSIKQAIGFSFIFYTKCKINLTNLDKYHLFLFNLESRMNFAIINSNINLFGNSRT